MAVVSRDMNAVLAARREKMSLTFDQFIYGLITEGWITEVEGLNWLRRDSLPTAIQNRINLLGPALRRKVLIYFYVSPSFKRNDQVILELASAFGKSDSVMDTFFEVYANG